MQIDDDEYHIKRNFATDICGFSSSSNLLLYRIASAYASLSNRTYSYALNICKLLMSFAIQKGLARQLTTSPSFNSSIIEDLYEVLLGDVLGVSGEFSSRRRGFLTIFFSNPVGTVRHCKHHHQQK
jgi:hypothetical protein